MTHRFKVDLRGIIDLAAHHLYASPDVFVREAIQNALDAITARRRLDPDHQGVVRIELTPGEGDGPSTLCIIDNGVGLTQDEVHEFLSTVGASTKRDDEQAEDAIGRIAEDAGFLGRFGIGLLSCFMVSDEIVVVTRSARNPDEVAVEWRGRSDGSYQVRPLPDSALAPGTSVYLTEKDDVEEYYSFDELVELAKRYAEMLPVRIIVAEGETETQINREALPWDMSPTDTIGLADLCQSSLGFRPLDTFPVRIEDGGLEGFAFVRPDRADAWDSTNKLYAHAMYVTDHVDGLVPRWATFVGCVLNSTGLRLTASREGVHHDDTLERCEEQLASIVRGRLLHLMRHDRDRFNAVMGVHDTEIRGLAIKDPDFFEVIIDLLEFDTTLGPIRFGEYRREHERLLLARTGEQFRRLNAVASAAGIRVFNGGYTYHEELLSRAAERHPEIEVLAFDAADMVELWSEPDDVGRFASLLDAGAPVVESRQAELVIRSFDPSSVPAYFALGIEAEFHRQLDRTKSHASGVWNEVLDAMAPRPDDLSPTRLCLNARSSLVQRLADTEDPELQRTGIEVLFVQALMGGQFALSGEELRLLNQGMEILLARCTGG